MQILSRILRLIRYCLPTRIGLFVSNADYEGEASSWNNVGDQ